MSKDPKVKMTWGLTLVPEVGNSSVGDINATCRLFSIATNAARIATIVLPEPTSPCNNLRMGSGFVRSDTISFSTKR